MLKKFPSVTISVTKRYSFFFRKLQMITVLLLIRDSYTGLYKILIYGSSLWGTVLIQTATVSAHGPLKGWVG